jgi:hypothetical protein
LRILSKTKIFSFSGFVKTGNTKRPIIATINNGMALIKLWNSNKFRKYTIAHNNAAKVITGYNFKYLKSTLDLCFMYSAIKINTYETIDAYIAPRIEYFGIKKTERKNEIAIPAVYIRPRKNVFASFKYTCSKTMIMTRNSGKKISKGI